MVFSIIEIGCRFGLILIWVVFALVFLFIVLQKIGFVFFIVYLLKCLSKHHLKVLWVQIAAIAWIYNSIVSDVLCFLPKKNHSPFLILFVKWLFVKPSEISLSNNYQPVLMDELSLDQFHKLCLYLNGIYSIGFQLGCRLYGSFWWKIVIVNR